MVTSGGENWYAHITS